MMLHRYGGGVDAGAVSRILAMPFPMLARLMGAAQRATSPDSAPGRPPSPGKRSDADIIRELDAKVAAARAAQPTQQET